MQLSHSQGINEPWLEHLSSGRVLHLCVHHTRFDPARVSHISIRVCRLNGVAPRLQNVGHWLNWENLSIEALAATLVRLATRPVIMVQPPPIRRSLLIRPEVGRLSSYIKDRERVVLWYAEISPSSSLSSSPSSGQAELP